MKKTRKQQVLDLLPNMAVTDIANKLGVSPSYVSQIKKGFSGENPRKKKLQVDIDKLREYEAMKLTSSEVEVITGISHTFLWELCKMYGIRFSRSRFMNDQQKNARFDELILQGFTKKIAGMMAKI